MTKLILPMGEIPGVIRESLRAVLSAHGFEFARVRPAVMGVAFGELVKLTPEERERVLFEAGNNATQSLFDLDMNPENGIGEAAPSTPSTADLLSVGQTLRALAHAHRQNADMAAVLSRVGEWLAATAKAELAKKAA